MPRGRKLDPDALREFLLALKVPEVDLDQQYCICYTSVNQSLVVKIISKEGLQREKSGPGNNWWMSYQVTRNWKEKKMSVRVLAG